MDNISYNNEFFRSRHGPCNAMQFILMCLDHIPSKEDYIY